MIGKLVFPIALLVSTGIVIGGYLAFGGDRGELRGEAVAVADRPAAAPAPAPAEIAGPAPAAITAARVEASAPPAPTAVRGTGAPALVDVRIDSIPSGATVTLVDGGRIQLVGDTPVDTAVDPSREYDLVFTYANQPPHVEHLDAGTTRRIAAVLATRERPARPVAGEGTLMVSSKPPCEIVIDGRPTGLTTPQRSILLPAGSHKVTLVNGERSIRKTLAVRIAANATEKIIQDLMK